MLSKMLILFILIILRDVPATITLTVHPRVEILSSAKSSVMAEARVIYDETRLSLVPGFSNPSEIVSASASSKIIFEFKSVQANFGFDPENPKPDYKLR